MERGRGTIPLLLTLGIVNMIEGRLGEVNDTKKEMSLMVCPGCWAFYPEEEYRIPDKLRKLSGYRNKMVGHWYSHCRKCRREE
jgi:hypothetical protein